MGFNNNTNGNAASINNSSSTREQQEERLRQLRREQAALELQMRMQDYATDYSIQWEWPAVIQSSSTTTTTTTDSNKDDGKALPIPLRTSEELIQHRLLEAGLMYEIPVTVGETAKTVNTFIADLLATDCFEEVKVEMGLVDKINNNNGGNTQQQQKQPANNADSNTGTSASSTPTTNGQLRVRLEEKKWYRLHAGGGIKTDQLFSGGDGNNNAERAASVEGGFLPTAELDVSVGLRNLTGNLDKTEASYALDTRNISTWKLQHERPLFAAFSKNSFLRQFLLGSCETGSQYALLAQACIDTVDYEWTRSYKEFQRLLSVKAGSHRSTFHPVQQVSSSQETLSVEWSLLFRDLVPQRLGSSINRFAFAASPQVCQAAGPSVKHSLQAEWSTNAAYLDHATNPTRGVQAQIQTELATPPGDVGFFKVTAGGALHVPLLTTTTAAATSTTMMKAETMGEQVQDGGTIAATANSAATKSILSLHASLHAGWLYNLSFGGLTKPAGLSDRFYVGGPLQLRGFSPAGIGPRAKAVPNSCPTSTSSSLPKNNGPGDAVGGDFFYTATAMASVAPSRFLPDLSILQSDAVRIFGFCNAGTCVGCLNQHIFQTDSPNLSSSSQLVTAILQSTRCSVGVGLTTAFAGPRLEVTYALPLRAGPADVRRRFQFGMGFSFG